jgi:predicted amidophosphoribosyltransferase
MPLIEVLRHTGYKAEQKHLSLESRATEAKHCYRLKRGTKAKIADKYIILIDDILTSGATTAACASLLKENSAAAVVCTTVAKTENKRKQK